MDSCFKIMIFSLFSICNWAYKMDSLPTIENEAFIKECIDLHNKFRSQVTPKASNMMRLSWDVNLAIIAKKWAEECEFENNPALGHRRMLHPAFPLVGENLWIGSVTIFSENVAITMWNNEEENYDFPTNQCTGVCGHYTQVVWADTYKIGCAVQFCPRVSHSLLPDGIIFVCNYGPAGNDYEQPYKEGGPCSACQEDTCVDQLCTNPKREREPPSPSAEKHKDPLIDQDAASHMPDEDAASHMPDEDAASHKPDESAANPQPEGVAANQKPDTEETTTGTYKVSLVIILVPVFAVLAIILVIVILIKRYFIK